MSEFRKDLCTLLDCIVQIVEPAQIEDHTDLWKPVYRMRHHLENLQFPRVFIPFAYRDFKAIFDNITCLCVELRSTYTDLNLSVMHKNAGIQLTLLNAGLEQVTDPKVVKVVEDIISCKKPGKQVR